MFFALRDERGTILVFFYPHGSCVLSDLAYVQDISPTTGKWRQDSAAKTMRQPQLLNPRLPDDAERLGCHRGIFHHRGSCYTSALSGFDGNTTLLRAKDTRHMEKSCYHPSCLPRGRQTTAQPCKTGQENTCLKTWLKRLGCWADTRVRVSVRWRKLGGKN
jgi:hypothetical protein